MTLQLKVISAEQTKGHLPSEIFLLVNGSQCGELFSYKSQQYKWNDGFKIICSHTDNLKIKLFSNQKFKDSDFLGEAHFHSKIFVTKHPKISLKNQEEFELNIQKDSKIIGILRIVATYDKAQNYQGEIPIQRDLGLGSSTRTHVNFFKGPCPTYNLFSILDNKVASNPVPEQQFKYMEQFYRDDVN